MGTVKGKPKRFWLQIAVEIAVKSFSINKLRPKWAGNSGLVGIVFSIGIKVANTILMTDLAQHLRKTEGLSPLEAIRRAAKLRVRPITMTALAAFFAMIPTALALETGTEANAPMGRAILGGLLAGEPATLFVVPALYAIMIRGNPAEPTDPEESERRLEQEREGQDEPDDDQSEPE